LPFAIVLSNICVGKKVELIQQDRGLGWLK